MRMSSLEELKSREREVDFLLGGTRFREDWDWLIEQAERVQELEDKCEYLSDMNEMLLDLNGVLPNEPELYIKLKKENKRYRKAINNIIEKVMLFGTNEEVYEAIQDAIKALEGDDD